MTVCLANRQKAKFLSSTVVLGERKSGEGRKHDTGKTGDGTNGKRRRASNARRNGKPGGRTRTSCEQRLTKRENATRRAGTSGGRRATKRENGTGEREASGGRRVTKW